MIPPLWYLGERLKSSGDAASYPKLQATGRDAQTLARIRVGCSRHATGKSPPSSTPLLPLLLRSLDSSPSIAQGDRTVEDEAICRGINGIDTEVAEPLELISTPRSGAR